MKKAVALLIFLLSVGLSFSQNYVTTTSLNIRDASNSTGHVVGQVPNGTPVQSLGENNGWIRIRYKAIFGYISSKYIRSSNTQATDIKSYTNPPKSSVHYYNNVDGNNVQAPTKYDKSPEGATAKCADGTYSFSQHARGTCSHHGGVAQWLH